MESISEYRASVAVWQYCPPVLFAFGTFGNTMIVLILRRMPMKRSSAMRVYLTSLAVSDTCVLYTGLLRGWIIHTFEVDLRTLHSAACKVHTWLVYSFLILSAWILTFLTIERTVSVWRPHRVSLLCTRGKAIIIVVVLVATSLFVNGHLLFSLDIVEIRNGTSKDCHSSDSGYEKFWDSIWTWVDLTLASLLPFAVVLLGNCMIVWKVCLSVRAARHLGSNRPEDISQRQKKMSSMTVMLMLLSVIFFLTTSPICVYSIIQPNLLENVQSDLDMARVDLAWAVVNMLMYVNNTINFYLYCLSGTRFRRELKKCLCCYTSTVLSPFKNADVVSTTNQSQYHGNNPVNQYPLSRIHIPVHSDPIPVPSPKCLGDRDKGNGKEQNNRPVPLSLQTYSDTYSSSSEF